MSATKLNQINVGLRRMGPSMRTGGTDKARDLTKTGDWAQQARATAEAQGGVRTEVLPAPGQLRL